MKTDTNTQTSALQFSPVVLFSFGPGLTRHQTRAGHFVANRYEGTGYKVPGLQSKAETGLWYCYAQGTGAGLEGEGVTPDAALADLRNRAADVRAELGRVYGV